MSAKTIIISRTDGIGDVVLTLPLAGVLKKLIPECKIIFLGTSYTREIVALCNNIDEFIAWNEIENKSESQQIKSLQADIIIHVFPQKKIARLAKKARIPLRIGTISRPYHWFTCNKKINLHRKNSPYHEAQLNLNLLKPLGGKDLYEISEINNYFGLNNIPELDKEFDVLIDKNKINLILHPKSKGSAREWGLDNFSKLIALLPEERFKIFITGTEEEGTAFRSALIAQHTEVVDLSGKMSIKQLISFIANADAIVAASTGPLHIAAALGKYALGLYAPMRPIHAGRWAPLGFHSSVLIKEKKCTQCRKSTKCECIESIMPEEVVDKLMEINKL